MSAVEKPVRRFPPPCWTQNEALALIQAYRERWYALRRGYLRTADWDAVAEEVGRLCPGATPPKTSAQCRHKMEKLRQRYRAEKQRAASFPGGQFISTWFYFEAMDSMEKNGNGNGGGSGSVSVSGSVPDEEAKSGNDFDSGRLKIVNSRINHQLSSGIDSVYGGLNPGRGIRFKPVSADGNLVAVGSRANNVRVSQLSHGYSAQEEDNDDEFEDVCYAETPIGKTSVKTLGLPSYTRYQTDNHISNAVKYQTLDHSDVRPRKFRKTGSNSNHNYWNENGQNNNHHNNNDDDDDHDDDDDLGEDDDVWVNEKYSERMNRNSGRHNLDGESEFSRGSKRGNDSMGQIVSSIKLLADGFVKMEKMKMDMVHEIEKMRMEAEMKRNKLLLESQKQIVEAFVKGLSEHKKQQQ